MFCLATRANCAKPPTLNQISKMPHPIWEVTGFVSRTNDDRTGLRLSNKKHSGVNETLKSGRKDMENFSEVSMSWQASKKKFSVLLHYLLIHGKNKVKWDLAISFFHFLLLLLLKFSLSNQWRMHIVSSGFFVSLS